ncbi:MAG: GTPase ObgE, partial [Bacteroidales bacterium]|nr:GTPase ObgE [Candidatus Cryptobacteroides aphodequi]
GGDGGRGGHIILRANPQFWTLIHLKYRKHVQAEDGGNGSGALQHGKNGADITLDVPVGTVVKDAETEEVLFDLTEAGEEKILCPGGRGGWGNDHFKTATQQTPRYAQSGEEGVEGWFILELKLLADVGLVGFPNAGKSTLLGSITSAKPKVASYAFTTLEPNLGIVRYYDDQSFVMADIPGIIEGAHEGRGIGTRFLRHIERNSVLLFMVSCTEEDIAGAYHTLLSELELYNPELLDKERVLAITKCDTIDKEIEKDLVRHLPRKIPHVFISSVSGEGLPELKDLLWKTLHK